MLEYTVRPISDRTGFTGAPGPGDRSMLARSSWESTQETLDRELRALEARQVVLEVDVRERDITVAGQLRANATVASSSPAVRLAFITDDGPMQFATDLFGWNYHDKPRAQGWQENVRAIALGLESLRRVDRYGITRRNEQYRGFLALPPGTGLAPSGMTTELAEHVLIQEADVEPVVYDWPGVLRLAQAAAHPDANNGDRARWNAVDEAEQVLRRAGRL